MDTPEPPERAIEGQRFYEELLELMQAFCLECERYEKHDWPKEKGDPT
jgi:hypothetical protein